MPHRRGGRSAAAPKAARRVGIAQAHADYPSASASSLTTRRPWAPAIFRLDVTHGSRAAIARIDHSQDRRRGRGPGAQLELVAVRTAGAGAGGTTHAAPVTAEVASGTPQQSRPRQFPWFSRRLDGPFVFPRRRLNAADQERSESFCLPLLRRRCSGGEAGTGAAAAAGGSAAGGETTRVRQPRNSKERWRRALSKLSLKRR